MSTPGIATTSNGDDHQHIRLACQACQRKKIKCDRNFPCGQCNRSSLQCVPSTRKPRTRHAGKRAVDSELRSRITKLESLVESLSGEVGLQDGSPTPPDDEDDDSKPTGTEAAASAASPAVGKYIGSPFWSSLTTEVQALREALEEDQAEDETSPISPETGTNGTNEQPSANDYDLIMCPPGAIYVMPGALNEPSPMMQSVLHCNFMQTVAPLFKLFHVPALKPFLTDGAPYLGRDATTPGNKALKAAIWAATVNTMSDEECLRGFGQLRANMVRQYRRAADVLLSQADVMNTNDLATLQAFVLYTVSQRISDLSRRAWTLTALVVRIARAMGLHHETSDRTPFERELRRRLWHQIRFLDIFTSIDRATDALIPAGSFDTPIPNNVNDSEFGETSTSIPNHTGLTEMSFALLTLEATTTTGRLNTTEVSPNGETWQRRLEIAHNFGKIVQEKYLQYCDMNDPWHRLIHAVGTSMTSGMILRAVRPMQRHVSSVPPRIDSPYVLQIAVDSLRSNEAVYADPDLEKWRWLIWVQWHALAVALAGLCSIRGTELADSAWDAVEKAYDRHSKHVADTRNGMLWRPIEKLYKTAKAFRDEGRRISISSKRNSPTVLNMTTHHATRTPLPPTPYPITSPSMTQYYQTQQQMPMRSMPMDAMDTSSPTNFGDSSMTLPDTNLTPPDMSWLDWERIMADLNQVDMTNVEMGDSQMPLMNPGLPPQEWGAVLHHDFGVSLDSTGGLGGTGFS